MDEILKQSRQLGLTVVPFLQWVSKPTPRVPRQHGDHALSLPAVIEDKQKLEFLKNRNRSFCLSCFWSRRPLRTARVVLETVKKTYPEPRKKGGRSTATVVVSIREHRRFFGQLFPSFRRRITVTAPRRFPRPNHSV